MLKLKPTKIHTVILVFRSQTIYNYRCIFYWSVNNFQNIRNDFNQQIKEQMAVKERAEIRTHLTEELEKQDKKHRRSR
jgi:cell division FtsZ-interacting protein ZapD